MFMLADRMAELEGRIKKAASDVAVQVAIKTAADLTKGTPVDTSKALSNWIVTQGGPNVGKIEAHFEGAFGSTRSESVEMTIADAKIALMEKKPGVPIYITNNQDYIVKLNEGSSSQAPAGFVQRIVNANKRYAKTLKLKV